MSRLRLNIHDIITVDLDVSLKLEEHIKRNLELLIADRADEGTPDLIVRDLVPSSVSCVFGFVQGVKYRFAHLKYENSESVAIMHQGRPAAVLVPDSPLKLYFARDLEQCTGRMYLLLLYAMSMALVHRQAFLFHGACLLPPGGGDGAVLLVGRRGSCKTCAGLTLMKEGWRYISDDKWVLKSSRAYLFEKKISVRDWHVDKLPWLFDFLPPSGQRRKSRVRRAVRKRINHFGRKLLPLELSARWENRWNACLRLPVDEIFPNISIQSSAVLKSVVLLQPGCLISLNRLPFNEGLRRMSGIQDEFFDELIPLPGLSRDLGWIESQEAWRKKLAGNFKETSFYELALPANVSFDQIQDEVRHCISSRLC